MFANKNKNVPKLSKSMFLKKTLIYKILIKKLLALLKICKIALPNYW